MHSHNRNSAHGKIIGTIAAAGDEVAQIINLRSAGIQPQSGGSIQIISGDGGVAVKIYATNKSPESETDDDGEIILPNNADAAKRKHWYLVRSFNVAENSSEYCHFHSGRAETDSNAMEYAVICIVLTAAAAESEYEIAPVWFA